MKKLLAISIGAAAVISSAFGQTTNINGAGASFPAPVYQHWTYTYSQSNPNAKVNYQSMGSGAGINQIKAGTVDFAGTDSPLTLEQQQKAGLQQFPMLMGGVVVIVNLPRVKTNELKLTRAVLADIFLGKITRWDDARISKLNPTIKLPRMSISVVRRADASGTTFIFTNYLAKISKAWADKVGCGAAVNWPVGMGGQKNPGVCNNVARIRGSIGYTEYTYAVEAKLNMPQLENKAGKFVEPSDAAFSAAAANADWKNAPGLYMVLTDQAGDDTWPLAGVTYILMREDCPPAMRVELIKYFNWCFSTGMAAAKKLDYVPIPDNVVKLVQKNIFKQD